MARQSLAARVTALEEKVGHKTIEEQFREQAELIDRRFDEGFRDQAELINRLFLERDKKWDLRFGNLEKDVSVLKSDVSILKKEHDLRPRRPQHPAEEAEMIDLVT